MTDSPLLIYAGRPSPNLLIAVALALGAHAMVAGLWALGGNHVTHATAPPTPLLAYLTLIEAPPETLPPPSRTYTKPTLASPETKLASSTPPARPTPSPASSPPPAGVGGYPAASTGSPVSPAVEHTPPEALAASPGGLSESPTAAETSSPPGTQASRGPTNPHAGGEQTAPQYSAAYLNNPRPDYPIMSRRLGEEGKVVLSVFVGTNGRPEKVELKSSSGFDRLDQAARDAVSQWQFIPARRGDEPVAAWVFVPVPFRLN
jgi:protein TonB